MKKFLLKIMIWVFPVWIFFIILTFYFYPISDKISGDLGRLGLIPFGKEYNEFLSKNYLNENLCNNINNIDSLYNLKCDVLTIGDSFSNQGIIGYQNYMTFKGLNVKNIKNINPVNYTYSLLTRNVLDSTNVKIIILESVEREITDRLSSVNQINIGIIKETTNNSTFKDIWRDSPLLYAKNVLLIRLGYKNSVYQCNLNNNLFSHENGDKLYFYRDDVELDVSIKKEDEHIIKDNTNMLFELAHEKGIKLIILVAADKYDIYQEFIVSNKYPQKTINEDLKRIIKNEGMVYSKDLFLPYIRKGEKDIYMINDSHWSYKASKIIADYLVNYINNNTF